MTLTTKALTKIVQLSLGDELAIVLDGYSSVLLDILDTNSELVQEHLDHDLDYQSTYQESRAPPY